MVSRAGALRPLTMFRGCRGRRDDVPAASFHFWGLYLSPLIGTIFIDLRPYRT